MNQTDIQSAELLCELYAKEHGKPLILPRFIHLVKSHNPADHLKVHIGIWDLISVNNVKTSEPPHRKWQTISGWVKNCTHVSVLPYMTPNSRLAINGFWKYHVEKLGYEGLVVRTSNGIYKLKPKGELDAVIIGINKKSGYGKTNLFAQKQVTSLKLALMTPEGNFVEVGDVSSGIDHQLRSALWRLMNFKIGEDDKTVYVKPIAVLTVEYTNLFKSRNKILQLTPQGYRHVGDMNLIRFRHPRLKHLRSDKKVNPQDLRLEQIP